MNNDWQRVPLKELAPAKSLPMPGENETVWNLSLDNIESHTGKIVEKKSCQVNELGSAKCVFDHRHVLYSKLRPYLNKVVLPDANGVGTSELIPLLPESRVDREFLAYYLRSPFFVDFANKNTRGANLPRISMNDFWAHCVPFPEALIEQKRIVSRIKECLARIEEIEMNSAGAAKDISALFPSILHSRFNGIQEKYSHRNLESVAEIRGGGSLPKGSESDLGDSSVLLVKVGDMNIPGNDRVVVSSRQYLNIDKAQRGLIPAGAIIFPKRGGAIATNKKRVIGRPALIDPNLMAVVAKPDVLDPEYLYFWAQTLDLNTLSNGGVIPQLNRKDLAPIEVPVPSLEAQASIAAELQKAEEYCVQLSRDFSEAQGHRANLRDAILRKAFSGEF